MFGLIYFIIYPLFFKEEVEKRKIREKYYLLKEKENKTNFEMLFILSFQSKADDVLKEILIKEKIKNIERLDVTIENVEEINITYKFKGFGIEISIRDNVVYYEVDSPNRFQKIRL